MVISFDTLPQELARQGKQLEKLEQMLQVLLGQKTESEQPITGKILMQKLGISAPTLICMRKRGDIPFIKVRGQYRYSYSAVLTALQNKKGGKHDK